jgi:uncharacterized protein YraI
MLLYRRPAVLITATLVALGPIGAQQSIAKIVVLSTVKLPVNIVLKAGPGTRYHKVGTASKGEQVVFEGPCYHGWCKVVEGKRGWVPRKYLVQEPRPERK